MAEGILKQKIAENNLAIEVDSAGTSNFHIGQAPDKRATAISKSHGIDISMLRGRQLAESDFDIFDRIFVMDYSNYENTIALVKDSERQAKVEMILNLSYPGENRSVPDPYFGGDEGFEQVYQLLNNACDVLITQL